MDGLERRGRGNGDPQKPNRRTQGEIMQPLHVENLLQMREELQNPRTVQRAGKVVRTVRSKCFHNYFLGLYFSGINKLFVKGKTDDVGNTVLP